MTDISKYEKLKEEDFCQKLGKVVNAVGLTVESAGPDARLGDLCEIYPETGKEKPSFPKWWAFTTRKLF